MKVWYPIYTLLLLVLFMIQRGSKNLLRKRQMKTMHYEVIINLTNACYFFGLII